MAKHSVFGSADLPVTLTLGDDGPGSIVVGNIFYTTLGAPTYACSGAKLWLPPGVTVPAQVTIEARYDVADINVNNLDTPALRSVTLSTAGVTGWLLVSWPTFAVEPGKMVLISSSFSGGRQTYLYHAQGDDNAIPATDGSPLYRSERATAPYNSSYYQINGGSVQGTAATFTYGVDIIVDDATPIAAYGFNELSGTTAYDATANSHDLTLNSTSNLGVSRIGGGLHQIGGGAANQITNAAPWFTAPDRTLSFWARRGDNGTADSQTVYQLDTTSTDVVFGISVSDGTQTAFTAKVDGVAITITHPVQAAGNWNYYTLTYDGLAVRGYVDGLLVGEQSAVGALDPTDDQLYIYGGEYQQQVIDDLRLFDVALSDADIVATMADDIIPPDATPPATPSGVTVSNIYQQVTLHWTASTDNVAVQNYVIYRSTTSGFTPTPADQVGGPSGTDYSEAVGVDIYYYRIAARDEAGNESDSSPEVMITTTANPAIDYLYPSALGWVPGTEYTDGVATGMSVGTFFGVDRPVSITGVRYYAPAAVSGGEAYLYDDVTKAVLASVVGVELVVGWNTILFDTPYVSIYGVGYIGAVYMPGASVSYTALPNAFDGTRTQVGPVYSVAPLSGFYDYNQRVPTVATTSWYGVDIIASSADGPTNESFGADIVAENILSGSSSEGWSIGGAGDITNLGFARQFSSNIGDTVEFSCHGTGTIIDIYRIGAYGGIGWRKVSTIDNTPTQQPDPDIIPDSNGGVTCTNWSTTATWTIPDDALSGLFVGVYRNLSRSDASYLPFAVRDDARPVDVIVKFSETTWALAYNYYGTPSSPLTGKSVYGSGGPMGDIGTRAHVGSYHRPIVTRAGIPQTYWLACEAPLIRFVESNGLNVKYVASKDVDENPALLQTAKVVVSSGHDEYWSEGMRDAFESFRDSGGHVLFMSGNEVFWRTRFSPDHTLMWVYKDTMDGPGAHVGGTPLDPVSWTGTWKDTRWVDRRPEHTITGTDFRMNGVNDIDAVIDHTAAFASHPFWRDTVVATGTSVTARGIIGFEADEIAPTQPAESTAVLAQHLVGINGARADDNGQSYDGNGDLNWGVVSQRYDSGAVVVGFGTCQWAWSLDAVHDRNVVPVEPALQQATLNLFADLGAAPATAIAGLVTPTAVSSLDVYGLNPLNIRSGKIKVWDGSSWQSHPVKVWDGSSWQSHPARGYSGDDFIVGK